MQCPVCQHPKRAEIEQKILAANSVGALDSTLRKIHEEFNLSLTDLKVHALMHSNTEKASTGDIEASLASKIKMTEAEALRRVLDQHMITMSNLGARINKAAVSEDPTDIIKIVQKPVVDLYLGCGAEIRGTVEQLIRLNAAVNGSEDTNTSSLKALVQILHPGQTGGDNQ